MSAQPFILAIEPDPRQAVSVRRVVREVRADLLLVDSKDAALAALERRVPDLLLVTALLSPRDETELLDRLRGLRGAEHLQTLTIPRLAAPRETRARTPKLLGRLRRTTAERVDQGCDPAIFASEIRTYLRVSREESGAWSPAADRPITPLDRAGIAKAFDERSVDVETAGEGTPGVIVEPVNDATAEPSPHHTVRLLASGIEPASAEPVADAPPATGEEVATEGTPEVIASPRFDDPEPASAGTESSPSTLVLLRQMLTTSAKPHPPPPRFFSCDVRPWVPEPLAPPAPDELRVQQIEPPPPPEDSGDPPVAPDVATPVVVPPTPEVAPEDTAWLDQALNSLWLEIQRGRAGETATGHHAPAAEPAVRTVADVASLEMPTVTPPLRPDPAPADAAPTPRARSRHRRARGQTRTAHETAAPRVSTPRLPAGTAAVAPTRPVVSAGSLTALAPVSTWTRSEYAVDEEPAPRRRHDELRDLLEGLNLPAAVAAVSYPAGCRLRHVRVRRVAPSPDGAGDTAGTSTRLPVVILSRRMLAELRGSAGGSGPPGAGDRGQ